MVRETYLPFLNSIEKQVRKGHVLDGREKKRIERIIRDTNEKSRAILQHSFLNELKSSPNTDIPPPTYELKFDSREEMETAEAIAADIGYVYFEDHSSFRITSERQLKAIQEKGINYIDVKL